jgi:cytochrome oxidase Cu insertion factor (SCO1/SenC/PrrC family)
MPRQKSIPGLFLWTALVLTLLFIAAKVTLKSGVKPLVGQTSEKLPVFGEISGFALTEAGGRNMKHSDLQGKIWIANFIFTHCAGPCPLMSGRMSLIAKQFEGEPHLRLVSFSVDPERDTPEVLTEYGKRFERNPEQWFFLTGEKMEIFKLAQQHFHLGVNDIPPEEREAPDQTVFHSTKFVLVDAEGKIRGYYASDQAADMDHLIRDTQTLLARVRG